MTPETTPLLRDLDRLQVGAVEKNGRRVEIRTPVSGEAGRVFRAPGVPLPPNIAEQSAT